jgi:hypothetical protein
VSKCGKLIKEQVRNESPKQLKVKEGKERIRSVFLKKISFARLVVVMSSLNFQVLFASVSVSNRSAAVARFGNSTEAAQT